MIATARPSAVRTISLSVIAVGAALVFPYLVHLLPAGQGPQVGATYLPIYWAPLLATALFGLVPGLAAAALGPILNHWLTGSPPEFLLLSMTLELVVFALLFALMLRISSRNLVAAPLAYLVGRVSVTAVLWLRDGMPNGAWSALGSSLQTAWPGIVIIAVAGAAATVAAARRMTRP